MPATTTSPLPVATGLDSLASRDFGLCRNKRIGVLANQCSFDACGHHLIEHLQRCGYTPAIAFSPEHGLWSTHQDMEAVALTHDPVFDVPVASLYGDSEGSLAPAAKQLREVDLLLVDLPDVGSRYYTYAATLVKIMRVAAGTSLRIVVLDRPNPLNGIDIEGGPVLNHLRSYVGELSIPQRHGLTLGELGELARRREELDVDYGIEPATGWDRASYHDQTGIPWLPPSPNMPTLATALVYPGMCLLEGTNVSEGRGTTTPFELFGAPFVRPARLAAHICGEDPCGGFQLTPAAFRPQFGKWADRVCLGLRVHVTERNLFKPLAFGLAVVKWLRLLYPDAFEWRTEAYEFVSEHLAIDLLLGDERYRKMLESEESVARVAGAMAADAASFPKERDGLLLY